MSAVCICTCQKRILRTKRTYIHTHMPERGLKNGSIDVSAGQ